MVYLYAVMGVVMMTGIMSIFEMGLSLTGQSLLPAPSIAYSKNSVSASKDAAIMQSLPTQEFDNSVLASSLCDALKSVDGRPWSLIDNSALKEDYFYGSCEVSLQSESDKDIKYRSIVRKNDDVDMPYQLFSCTLSAGKTKCYFEKTAEAL